MAPVLDHKPCRVPGLGSAFMWVVGRGPSLAAQQPTSDLDYRSEVVDSASNSKATSTAVCCLQCACRNAGDSRLMAQDAVSREAVFKVTDSATSKRHSPSKPLSRYVHSKSRAVVNCKRLHKDRTNLPKGSRKWGISGWPMPYTTLVSGSASA